MTGNTQLRSELRCAAGHSQGRGSIGLKILLLVCLIWGLTACGELSEAQTIDTTILDDEVEAVSFQDIDSAIKRLYEEHPDILEYTIQSVYYTEETRDKVLNVCHQGSITSTNQSELETQKVLACAPLIFFFYNYGNEMAVTDSVDIARQLYWFTLGDNPLINDSGEAFKSTLQGWGID